MRKPTERKKAVVSAGVTTLGTVSSLGILEAANMGLNPMQILIVTVVSPLITAIIRYIEAKADKA